MSVQRTRTKQLRAPLTTTLGHPKSTQCNSTRVRFYTYQTISLAIAARKLFRRVCSTVLNERIAIT